MTVARFREVFPNARWSDTLQAWTVPGKTARRRIDKFLASEADRRTPFEEERGRDAYEFEPILSPYDGAQEEAAACAQRRSPAAGRPVATTAFGIVVITEITGELVDAEEVAEHHPDADDEHVWAGWRAATLDELVHTWPGRARPGEYERLRGWWQLPLRSISTVRPQQRYFGGQKYIFSRAIVVPAEIVNAAEPACALWWCVALLRIASMHDGTKAHVAQRLLAFAP